MLPLLYILTAVLAYVVCAVNPAIVLSRIIYHEDVRHAGSGNAGFTNFKRVYGAKYAWLVFLCDVMKGILVFCAAGAAFSYILGSRQLGIAYAGVFAMLGHTCPVYYGFRGGKGFLVCATLIWFLDWRAGLVATALFLLLLFGAKYMSLASMCSMLGGVAALIFFGASPAVCVLFGGCAAFMIFRHRSNIVRLCRGTESRFTLGHAHGTEPAREVTENDGNR